MNKNLKQKPARRGLTRPRRGVYMLELILILPLILLVLVILYQVSVMMTTYQALRLTAFNASVAFAQTLDSGTIQTNVESAIRTSIDGKYFRSATIARATTATDWGTTDDSNCKIKYRLLTSTVDGGNRTWAYYADSSAIASGTIIAVELKLENADDVFPGYWLLSKFTGVDAVKSESMVLSQITAKK